MPVIITAAFKQCQEGLLAYLEISFVKGLEIGSLEMHSLGC